MGYIYMEITWDIYGIIRDIVIWDYNYISNNMGLVTIMWDDHLMVYNQNIPYID